MINRESFQNPAANPRTAAAERALPETASSSVQLVQLEATLQSEIRTGLPNWKRSFAFGARLVSAVFAVIGLTVVLVSCTPLVRWWGYRLAGHWTDPRGDILIMLAGSEGPASMIGYDTYLRTEYALRSYRQDEFRTVLVSGGGPGTPVAVTMRDFLICNGVPSSAILTETASMSTRENALLTERMLRGIPGRKVLLTSDYHMYRAYRAFRKTGLDVTPRPFPDVIKRAGSWGGRWPAFLDLVIETAKIIYYEYRSWI